jgi:hypothetical protein
MLCFRRVKGLKIGGNELSEEDLVVLQRAASRMASSRTHEAN